jgi:hypothetical protein
MTLALIAAALVWAAVFAVGWMYFAPAGLLARLLLHVTRP